MRLIKRLLAFLLIIILLALLAIYYPYLVSLLTGKSVVNTSNINYQTEKAFVIRVIDGDTVETDLGNVRLLGINTPEKKKPYYEEAKEFLIIEIENKSIELLRDKEDTDKYDRRLRYVFYENRLLNVEILQQGIATSFMLNDLKYKDKLAGAEKFAKQNEIGLWKKSDDVCSDCIKLLELNGEEEFFVIKNNCEFDCNLNGWLVKDDANHFFQLNNLQGGEEKRYDSKNIWNDAGDRFFMRDDEGKLVVFYEY